MPLNPLTSPLGVHLAPDATAGATAAVFAAHADAVSVCLLGDDGRIRETVELPTQVYGVWRGLLPTAREGDRYAVRAHGAWDPRRGHRHNPDKLLLDPYARYIAGDVEWGQPVFAHQVDEEDWTPAGQDPTLRQTDRRDATPNLGKTPVGVIATPPAADTAARPRTSWTDTVIYEAHLRGLTMRHPLVPKESRGTWAGLAHPAVVEYLVNLGITAVELLPVFAVADETHLVRRGLRNYWGYNTLGFFAPELRYVSPGARRQGPQAVFAEIRDAVEALHTAGLEVWLDVVYNHTAESDIAGPTFSWRGLDASSYYRLDDSGRYLDLTGTGNTLDFSHPRVVQLGLDSLRYWVQHFGIDGYRFDLAPVLARRGPSQGEAFDPDHPFLVAARTDPALADVKLVAEPWDLGHHGWRTGQFPPPFAEWNDHFRNTIRTFWLTDGANEARGRRVSDVSHLATRLAGSSDAFGAPSRSADHVIRPATAAVNFVTAHDGFTLADLTAYEQRHNEANGENNQDGARDNRSWNHGVEGPTKDAAILAARTNTAKAMLGTLLLSAGTPLLVAGDELGRTQHGNNNAYCLDHESIWLDWESADHDLVAHVRALLRMRRAEPALGQLNRFTGQQDADGFRDVVWYGPDGKAMDQVAWHNPAVRTLQMMVNGVRLDASSVLVIVNGGPATEIALPAPKWATGYRQLWSSDDAAPAGVEGPQATPGSAVSMPARCVQVWRALDARVVDVR